ncbi:MAG: hypothetical protein DMG81_05100 [Acidobacteria bacterium]|nr:MAG: hypothetical protein DMG81_05100 [Acidobacteriota bacterium]
MKRQKTQWERIKTVAGLALAGPGLFFLFGHLVDVAGRLGTVLGQTASAKLEIVSSIMLAASLNLHQVTDGLIGLLWPALLVGVGTALLGDVSGHNSDHEMKRQTSDPCVGCA